MVGVVVASAGMALRFLSQVGVQVAVAPGDQQAVAGGQAPQGPVDQQVGAPVQAEAAEADLGRRGGGGGAQGRYPSAVTRPAGS